MGDDLSMSERSMQLSRALNEASEGVQIEFRRREDIAKGVRLYMESIWDQIDEIVPKLDDGRLSKRKVLEIGLICGGALVNWLTSASGSEGWHWGVGAWMALVGWFLILWSTIEQLLQKSDLARLRGVEQEALGRWVSAGASSDDFWAYRDTRRGISKAFSESEIERLNKLESKLDGLWLNVQEMIFRRSSGNLFVL